MSKSHHDIKHQSHKISDAKPRGYRWVGKQALLAWPMVSFWILQHRKKKSKYIDRILLRRDGKYGYMLNIEQKVGDVVSLKRVVVT